MAGQSIIESGCVKMHEDRFEKAEPGDICLTFADAGRGELPVTHAFLEGVTASDALNISMLETGSGLVVTVHPDLCDYPITRPLDEQTEKLKSYRNRFCVLRRNADPYSNFFRVETETDGEVWVYNKGSRTLRFQMPDGSVRRACAGYVQPLAPSSRQVQLAPTQILLDLGDNPLDFQISAVHVKYGESPWRRGGIEYLDGAHIDSYACRILCGDDCLGLVESYSKIFLRNFRLEFLDLESYGPGEWFVRNKGGEPLALRLPDGREAQAPADGRIYRLESLAGCAEKAGAQ